MNNWYATIYKACIYAGMIAFIIGFFTDSKTSLGAYISGYSVSILGVMMILTILFTNIINNTQNEPFTKIFTTIFATAGPFILILAVISFVLYLLITYQKNIVNGHVAPSYNSFSQIIVMLLFIQFYLVNSNISEEKFQITGKLSRVTSNIIYLLGVLTGISSITLYTILKYFSTDGFTLIN